MLKLVGRISLLQERFSNMPIERKWVEQIRENAIFGSTVAGLNLDGTRVTLKDQKEINKIQSTSIRQRVLNEIELRNSFPIYFKTEEFGIEQIHYLHRFLDNIYDEGAAQRGKFRKSQEVEDAKVYKKLKSAIPRYGFLQREVEEFAEIINAADIQAHVMAALVYANFISLSPYSRGNSQVGRILSKGYLFVKKFDIDQILSIEPFFVQRKDRYYRYLNKYLMGKPSSWIEFYLKAVVQGYKDLAREVELVSAGTIRPLESQVIRLTDRQRSIVELLKKNSQMSGSEVATILGVTRQNIFVIMQKLLEKKVVEKVGKGSASRYKLRKS